MLGLDAYGSSSSDDEDERTATTHEPPKTTTETKTGAKPNGPVLSFSHLPAPASTSVNVIRRQRFISTLPTVSDSDDEDSDGSGVSRKRQKSAAAVGTSSVAASLRATLPKPTRGGGRGASGGTMLELGSGWDVERRKVYEDVRTGSGDVDEGDEEEAEVGPCAADAYAVGDDGEYVGGAAWDAYAVGDDGLTAAEHTAAATVSDIDAMLAQAAKEEQERSGREVQIVTLSSHDVRRGPSTSSAPIVQMEGLLANVNTTKTSSTARHKHQLTSLLHEAKVEESRILEAGLKANQMRGQARRKYGW